MPAVSDIPATTVAWLTSAENPAVAAITRRELLREVGNSSGEESTTCTTKATELTSLWARRNEYAPVAAILDRLPQILDPAQPTWDYQKYRGPLWQVHFLGELWANGRDERLEPLVDHAFSHQLDDGAWSVNGRAHGAIPCLTANVGRALARMGWARDERVVRALAWVTTFVSDNDGPVCARGGSQYTLNGYCHMLAPKLLLFLAQVPHDAWPSGAEELRAQCVSVLRDREVYRCLPDGSREYRDAVCKTKAAEVPRLRAEWLAEHGPLTYGDKPGWLKFGFPLSYNSDALEALAALAAVGESTRPEYEPALELVRNAADEQMRWRLRNSFNGKMLADVEKKGQPSRWLTLRALQVLGHFGR